jgi:DNA-binding NtrC family response regulator
LAKPCSVLIVEDEPLLQEVFETVFAENGCEVSLACDGASMREALAAGEIDVVVLDIALPGRENGLDLAHEAGGSGRGVVLITGNHSHFDALVKSGHRYLFKPFRIEDLLQAVDELAEAAMSSGTTKRRRREQ